MKNYEFYKEYFDTLGLPCSSSTTLKDVNKKYKKVALKFHPDKNNNSTEVNRFKEMSQARDKLREFFSPEKKNDAPEVKCGTTVEEVRAYFKEHPYLFEMEHCVLLHKLFHAYLLKNDIGIVQLFLNEFKVTPNFLVNHGEYSQSALHFVCSNWLEEMNTGIIKALLEKNADPNLIQKHTFLSEVDYQPSKSPLHALVERCEWLNHNLSSSKIAEITALLLEYGADAKKPITSFRYYKFHYYSLLGKALKLFETKNNSKFFLERLENAFLIIESLLLYGVPLTEKIRGEDEKGCDVVYRQSFDVSTLSITSNSAYVRTKKALFYVTKESGEYTKVQIADEKLNMFDGAIKHTFTARKLSKDELKTITSITGHVHKERAFYTHSCLINVKIFKRGASLEYLTPEQKKWALERLDRIEKKIRCRTAFDKAVSCLEQNKDGYVACFQEASCRDAVLFKQLIQHLFSRQGQFKDISLDNKSLQTLYRLEFIRNHLDDSFFEVSKNYVSDSAKQYLQSLSILYAQAKSVKKVIVSGEEAISEEKNKLKDYYHQLIKYKNESMQTLAELIKKEKIIQNKTAKSDLFSLAVQDSQKKMAQVFEKFEKKIKMSIQKNKYNLEDLTAPYKPIMNNICFFNNYASDAFNQRQRHNPQRIAYCLYFMQKMTIEFKQDDLLQPSVELLKNLYLLKGICLAEVHSQTYLQTIFNCAMTSRLCEHVELEIKKLENMLKTKGVNLDGDKDIQFKRQQIQSVNNAYGTAWRRFKTALFLNKIDIDPNLEEAREHALKILTAK